VSTIYSLGPECLSEEETSDDLIFNVVELSSREDMDLVHWGKEGRSVAV
jgi:hypothetical protein